MTTITLLLTFAATAIAAEDVIGFRNGGSGCYPEADPPLEWSPTTNVRWRWDAPVFGTSIASAILVGDRVITVAQPMTLVCLDKDSGRQLWTRERYLASGSGDGMAATMHAAILRDHRIAQLAQLLRKVRGPAALWKEPRDIRTMARSTKDLSDADRAFYESRAAMIEQALAAAGKDTAALTAELAKLKAQYPAKTDKQARRAFVTANGRQAAATPASDGERIVAVFSPGLVVCVDLDGAVQWCQAIVDEAGRPATASWGTFAGSPRMADGKVLLQWGNQLQALDATSGKVLWRQQHGKGAFACAATPALGNAGGGWYFMREHGEVGLLDSGEIVFRPPLTTEPAYRKQLHDRYFALSASSDRSVLHAVHAAVALPERSGQQPRALWELPAERVQHKGKAADGVVYGGNHEYCAAAVDSRHVYYLRTQVSRTLSVLDAATGAVVCEPMSGPWGGTYADLSTAGKHLFVFQANHSPKHHDGACFVYTAGAKPEPVRTNRLERVVANTPVFAGRRMYLRTVRGLWCIEKP